MSKKKVGIIIGTVAVIAAAAAVAVWKFGGNMGHDSKDRVYVEKVSSIMGSSAGMQNRYSGLVQPQKTVDINADSERTIKEFLVKEGDTVEEGTPLFVYDTEDLEMDLQQAKLEIENTDLEISGYRSQIAELEKERNAASEDGKFEYTTQIQSVQTQIRQAEYEKSSKKLDIDKIQAKIDNSEVASTAEGVVKTLNDPKTSDANNMGGENNATISIMVTGTYRVKGTLDEQTINAVYPGSPVIIRSRVDETQTWTGTVDNIDTGETAGSDNDEMMSYSSGGDDGSNSASKYPFYISLDNADGLILGQHVLIELDQGQTEEKEGLWLYASYIVMGEGGNGEESLAMDQSMDIAGESLFNTEADIAGESLFNTETDIAGESLFNTETGFDALGDLGGDSDIASDVDVSGADTGTGEAFVWADDGNGKLMKKPVVLGEYDPMMDEYQILSGLTENDYIAFPMEGLYEGIITVTDQEEVDYSSGLYNQEGTEYMDEFGTEMLDENWDGTEMMFDGDSVNMDEFGTEQMYPVDITDFGNGGEDGSDTEEVSE
ncbi:efflux RND transporter periplasmic adaptor subunit [Roseburia sp. 1XD42-69]|uniref:efflux RND transporter periplasmic adaptor subunit n=1 Tax=Roseburia sp. 1XD42-69 TaxID=2320088 RepID=UPI001314CE95|nr:efflux RND transporter periplasmic adaptor subunit [Roseburia sp. 1XD42-69]